MMGHGKILHLNMRFLLNFKNGIYLTYMGKTLHSIFYRYFYEEIVFPFKNILIEEL